MNFDFNENQTILRNSAREFLRIECPTATLVRAMESDPQGYSVELWKKMADMGWMGIVFPEEYGGTGQKYMDLVVLLEEMGRSCVPGPFLSTVLCGLMILWSGNPEQKPRLLPDLVNGNSLFTLAMLETDGRYSADNIGLKAQPSLDNFVLNGTKMFVSDAHIADHFICVARTMDDRAQAEQGITLFVVDADSPGIICTSLGDDTIARDKIFRIDFIDVPVAQNNMLGELHLGWPFVEKLIRHGAIAECARMLGGAKRVLEMSTDYAKERQQFGRPIGAFQKIQHHLVDMLTAMEGSHYITYQAAWKLDEGLSCAREVSMAKAWVSEAYYNICLNGHQIHGGLGFTQDHDMGLYFRRAKAQEVSYGDADFHKDKLVHVIGLI